MCTYQVGRTLGTPTRQPVELRPPPWQPGRATPACRHLIRARSLSPREAPQSRQGGQAGAARQSVEHVEGARAGVTWPWPARVRRAGRARAAGAGTELVVVRPRLLLLLSPRLPGTQREALLVLPFSGARPCCMYIPGRRRPRRATTRVPRRNAERELARCCWCWRPNIITTAAAPSAASPCAGRGSCQATICACSVVSGTLPTA